MKKVILAGLLLTSFSALSATKTVDLYKNENCGCCHLWGEAIKKAGYDVVVHNISYDDLDKLNKDSNIPAGLVSCHTAKINGKVIVGHLPIDSLNQIESLPAETIGLAVVGMPAGSLGMEQPDGYSQSYEVISFNEKGEQSTFKTY